MKKSFWLYKKTKLHNINLHPSFCIEGRSFSINDLTELGYSYIKEGEEFEKHIGEFILNWIDNSSVITVHTSGSTGTPKPIDLRKEYMVNSALATGKFFKLKANDSALLCLPATYIAGKMMLVRAMVLGLDLYIIPPTSNPLSTINRTYDFGAMVPLQVMNSLSFVSQIKSLLIGGAPISAELRAKLKVLNNDCYETYGMTETITHIAIKPLNHFEKVDKEIPFKTLPEVTISKDERNCLVINAPKVSKEIIITNDVIELVSNNEFRWLGRYDNVINSGGVKLYPEQIEEILSKYLSVPFFVTGKKDKELGERVVLVVEKSANIPQVETILTSIKEFKKYERPKVILISDKFERTGSGKIQRQKTFQKILNTYKNH